VTEFWTVFAAILAADAALEGAKSLIRALTRHKPLRAPNGRFCRAPLR
jgi:hypothetical protein